MRNAGKFLTRFWSDEEGAVGTEYGVLLVIIALGMAIAATFLGGEISNALNRAGSCLAAGPNCSP